MEYYMDEKWKLSKEDRPHASSNKSSLQKSFSQKNPFGLSRSTSTKSSSLPRSSSQRCSEFTRKCKEQKAKFYIVKRCIGMLVSWKKDRDS